jgi:pimeloyl-ACP methyl ester carboxylesterase
MATTDSSACNPQDLSATHPGPGSPNRLLLRLVHGTFAQDAPWTHKDSLLSGHLAAHFPGAEITPFKWTSANSNIDRARAVRKLASEVAAHQRQFPDDRFVLIGHSHGGNIALGAASSLQRRGRKVAGVVCLATPVLTIVPRSLRMARQLGALARFALVAIIFGAIARSVSQWSIHIQQRLNRWWFAQIGGEWIFHFADAVGHWIAPVLILMGVARVLGVMYLGMATRPTSLRSVSRLRHAMSRYRFIAIPDIPKLFLRAKRDEVIVWLRLTSAGAGLLRMWSVAQRLIAAMMIPAIAVLSVVTGWKVTAAGASKNYQALAAAETILYSGCAALGLVTIALLVLSTIAILQLTLHGRMWGFGAMTLMDHYYVRLRASPLAPSGNDSVANKEFRYPWWKRPRTLRHSRLYEDPAALDILCTWLAKL